MPTSRSTCISFFRANLKAVRWSGVYRFAYLTSKKAMSFEARLHPGFKLHRANRRYMEDLDLDLDLDLLYYDFTASSDSVSTHPHVVIF